MGREVETWRYYLENQGIDFTERRNQLQNDFWIFLIVESYQSEWSDRFFNARCDLWSGYEFIMEKKVVSVFFFENGKHFSFAIDMEWTKNYNLRV